MSQLQDPTVDTSDKNDPLLKAIAKRKKDHVVRVIKNTFENLSTISFHCLDESESDKEHPS